MDIPLPSLVAHRFILAMAAFLVFVAPTVDAHIAHPTSSTVLDIGEFKLAITPAPSPVLAGTPTKIVLIDVQEDSERPLPGASILITSWNGEPIAQHEFHENGSVWETPPITFQDTGMFSGRIILEPEDGSEGRFSFDVYRMLPFDFAPIDATSDPTARVPYTLNFQTVDRANGRPQEYIADLRAMIFPAGTNPARGDPYENATFTKNGTAANWTAPFTFDFAGPWRIQLASDSGGFEMMEAPPWQIDVLPAPIPDRKAPPANLAFVVALVVALALTMRRRRARAQ